MASQELSLDKCLVEEPTVHPPLKAPCVPYGQGPAVALIGDSHAAQLAGALRKISTANGYRLVELTKGNCQALGAGVTRSIPGQPEFAQHCTQFNRERLAYVVADPNIKVVIIAGFWSDALEYMGEFYPANVHAPQTSLPRAESREPRAESREPRAESRESLERGLNEVVRQLSLANKTIYLVQDNPVFAVNPVLAMKAALIKPRHALASLVASSTLLYQGDFAPEPSSPRVEDARLVIARVSAENPNVHLIDLQRALCTGDSCRFADGDQSLYMDANHLSSLGAQIAVAGLRLP